MVCETIVGLSYETGGAGGVQVLPSHPLPVLSSAISATTSRMTTNLSVMNESNDVSVVLEENKMMSPAAVNKETGGGKTDLDSPANVPSSQESKSKPSSNNNKSSSDAKDQELLPKSQEQSESQFVAGYPHLMPQVGSAAAYYLGYSQSQMPPEPPSPATGMSTVAYEAGSFFQQPGAFAPLTNPAGTPLSPPRPTTTPTMGVLPPASPLFPRVTSGGRLTNSTSGDRPSVAPPSPNLVYMASQLGSSSMYPQYPVVPTAGSQSSDSPDDTNAWSDRYAAAQGYQQSSPQVMSYGMPLPTRAAAGGRAYSFEEAMLPPSALDQLDQANPAYSPYGGSQASPIPTGATLFAQQSWYGSGPPDMYSSPGSPLQPRPTAHPQMGMYAGAVAGSLRGMAPYGQFYPASSPGPPIQTTASNKGPDGANLFIFHIPNHFTNLDMYQLFCPYGNLLSVRIMVEKDTGRSRGFGFVSYDNPESAALAIKELNGFAIGNKRLKVQHKQIRSKDMHNGREIGHGGSFDMHDPDEAPFPRTQFPSSSLPPSGPMASQNMMWYNNKTTGTAATSQASTGLVGVSSTDGGVSTGTLGHDEDTEVTNSSTTAAAEASSLMGANESALSNLGSLQNALPDVAGKDEHHSD